jgi:hypothetical protein
LRVTALVDVVTGVVVFVVVVVVGVTVDPQADNMNALAMMAGTTTRDRCIGVEPPSGAGTSVPQDQVSNEPYRSPDGGHRRNSLVDSTP